MGCIWDKRGELICMCVCVYVRACKVQTRDPRAHVNLT